VPDILLSTLNAKYVHAAFGLRCLLANLGELRPRAAIAEFDVDRRPVEVAEEILAAAPSILGLGVYVWNVAPATRLVALLKRLRPELRVVLGGPEVSHEWEDQEIVRLADHVVTGEADLAFAGLCRRLLAPDAAAAPPPKVVVAPPPDLDALASPYALYDAHDLADRVVYVEASRGCPFSCEFCLSALDVPVRAFRTEAFLEDMGRLLDRGLRRFKFVDRTFNLRPETSARILRFFLERMTPGLFVHFEMVPDRLPEALRGIIAAFPPGSLQFEVGIQTFDPEVEGLISRRQDHARLEDNLRWLRDTGVVHVYADLIAGLPGETLGSFGAGFDRLVALGPQEIQVGMLKRLRGTPIARHEREWAMTYDPHPPYEVLSTRTMDFGTLARLRRFARFWDLYGNSGHFVRSLPLAWAGGGSPFAAFMAFADWLHARGVQGHGVALPRRHELLWRWLTGERGVPEATAGPACAADFLGPGRRDLPAWLAPWRQEPSARRPLPGHGKAALPKRQARHLAGAG
jgi:radical SAM superfamily enzyme YgiQ (UPF0313 family)